MKERSCIAVLFAIIALLLTSASGFSRSTGHSIKTSGKHKRVKRSEQGRKIEVGEKYSVRRGDNLTSIAKEFGTTPKAIKSANHLRSNRIKAGQLLMIPGRKPAAIPETKMAESRNTVAEPIPAASVQPRNTSDESQDELSPARLRLIQAGFEMIGVRYRFGGSGKSGFDCSGLVKSLFSKFDINLPRSSREQFKQGQKVGRDELEVGDLVFFSSGGTQPTHVGIYVGNDKFLHAARKARQVIVSDINKIWYKMRYLGARRVTDLWSDAPATETSSDN